MWGVAESDLLGPPESSPSSRSLVTVKLYCDFFFLNLKPKLNFRRAILKHIINTEKLGK
jgi:hypothetical protein